MAALYKMFSCRGGLNWIYGECTVNNVLLSRWFDLVQHGYRTITTGCYFMKIIFCRKKPKNEFPKNFGPKLQFSLRPQPDYVCCQKTR